MREDLTIIDYNLEDTNNSNFIDTITIVIKNDGRTNYNISDLLVDRDDSSIEWTLGKSVYLITNNDITIINCSASTFNDELAYGQTAKFKLVYGKKILIFSFRIPAEFSTFDIVAGENFENFTYANWTHNLLYEHNVYGYHNISDWKITNTTGNDYWHCTSNDCQYVYKNHTDWLFNSGNISCDLSTIGNDAMGIIFKYYQSGLYPRFYIVWYTLDHPSARNGPHVGEEGIFDWDSFQVLSNVGIGIVLGLIIFSRLLNWLLKTFPGLSLAVLSGFMIGALPSIWPFWTYQYALDPTKLSKGPQLLLENVYFPDPFSHLFLSGGACMAIGFSLIFLIEYLASAKKSFSLKRSKNASKNEIESFYH